MASLSPPNSLGVHREILQKKKLKLSYLFLYSNKTSNKEEIKRRQSKYEGQNGMKSFKMKEKETLANGYNLGDDDSIMGEDADLAGIHIFHNSIKIL